MIKTTAQKIYLGLIFIFLYAPIITLIVLSFNASKTRAKWGGFTTKWYAALFRNEQIMQALWNTLALAILSALIATLIGTIACIAMQSMKRTSRAVLMGITNIPMLNAEIVTGISLMLLFLSFGIKFGFGTILLAHITFNIPYVILSVMPRMKQLNPSTYEAALDLGASHTYAFFKVVFPDILPGILSGFLMAFTMSLDYPLYQGSRCRHPVHQDLYGSKKRYQTGNVRTIHHYIRNCIDFTFVSKLHTQRKEKEITFSTYILGGK